MEARIERSDDRQALFGLPFENAIRIHRENAATNEARGMGKGESGGYPVDHWQAPTIEAL